MIHECFFSPEALQTALDTPYPQAVFITTYISDHINAGKWGGYTPPPMPGRPAEAGERR